MDNIHLFLLNIHTHTNSVLIVFVLASFYISNWTIHFICCSQFVILFLPVIYLMPILFKGQFIHKFLFFFVEFISVFRVRKIQQQQKIIFVLFYYPIHFNGIFPLIFVLFCFVRNISIPISQYEYSLTEFSFILKLNEWKFSPLFIELINHFLFVLFVHFDMIKWQKILPGVT